MHRRESQQNLINKYSIKFKKYFGQNFLVDDYYSEQLLEAADLNSNDIVIEIGTGLGAITYPLSDRVKYVFTFEKDIEVFNQFQKELEGLTNITPLSIDLLDSKGELSEVIHSSIDKKDRDDTLSIKKHGYKIVSSLPYNVSKRFVNYFLLQNTYPKTITYLLQKEVAMKYCAKVPHATFLSNMISLFGDCTYKGTVPKEAFYPIPKVDGGIIHIEINEEKAEKADEQFIKFIKAGFSSPRKNISNVISSNMHIDKAEMNNTLLNLQLDPNLRAENLTIDQWKVLYKNLLINKQ